MWNQWVWFLDILSNLNVENSNNHEKYNVSEKVSVALPLS